MLASGKIAGYDKKSTLTSRRGDIWWVFLPLALVGLITVGTARADSTLEKVKAAGGFSCGVPTGTPGYAQPDAQGVYSGFDIDICKALSAAIFGDPVGRDIGGAVLVKQP